MSDGSGNNGRHRGPGIAPERLDGWKEIAAYLRRSVRTVQRWEAQLQLPVHRLTTGQADSVYAIPAELDAWLLATKDAREADDESATTASVVEPLSKLAPPGGVEAQAPPPADIAAGRAPGRAHHWPFITLVAVVIAGLGIAAWAGLIRVEWPAAKEAVGGPGGRPVSVTPEGRTLIFRDAAGFETGRHTFGDDLEDFRPPDARSKMARIADLDGDGMPEVIVIRSLFEDTGVYVFEADGRQRFHWRPTRTVRYGESLPQGPHLFGTDIFLPAVPDGTFFVAAHVLSEFPSVLLHFDAHGKRLHEFWNDGYIESFRQVRRDSTTWTFLGVVNNELKSAGLVAFSGPPAGFAPSRLPAYRCVDCPGPEVASYLVFPPSRLQKRIGCLPGTSHLHPDGANGVMAQVQAGDHCTPGHGPADVEWAYYIVGFDLAVARATVGSGFPALVDRLIAQKRIGLTVDDQYRGESDLFPVRRWNSARADWDELTRPGVTAGTTDARGDRH